MKFTIDLEKQTLHVKKATELQEFPLYSQTAFHYLSELWLQVGWNERYHYTFTWLGIPSLQLPEDLLRLQEVIVTLQPDVIVEVGIAMGGTLIFYASLCEILNHGRVIGIDCAIRPYNRKRLEEHALASRFTLIEGDSIMSATVEELKKKIYPSETVLVILDSNHSKKHVLAELEIYQSFVSERSYLIVCDGFKKELAPVPRGKPHWSWDNPADAVAEFLQSHPQFYLETPERRYNRSSIRESVTHLKNAWLRRS